MDLPELPMTAREVAKAYGLPYQTVLLEIREGRLHARHKKGQTRQWWVTKADLTQWIEEGMWK